MDLILSGAVTALAVYTGLMGYYFTKRLINRSQEPRCTRSETAAVPVELTRAPAWVDDSEPDDPERETREERLAREREEQRGFYS